MSTERNESDNMFLTWVPNNSERAVTTGSGPRSTVHKVDLGWANGHHYGTRRRFSNFEV